MQQTKKYESYCMKDVVDNLGRGKKTLRAASTVLIKHALKIQTYLGVSYA